MKIAVSGGGGTGKTTLINHIATTIRYPVLPDFMDIVLNEFGFKSPKELDDETSRKLRLLTLERKIKAEESEERFLSDKSVVDYHAYWLLLSAMGATEETNKKFYELTKEHVKIYDLIIIPSLRDFQNIDNGIRNTNFYHKYRVHTLIKGLYQELKVPFTEYSLNLQDLPEKVVKDLEII